MTRVLLCLSVAVLLSACGGSADLAVDLRTDLVPGLEFDAVTVRLDEAEPREVAVSVGEDFDRGRRVAEFPNVATGDRRVRVELVQRGAVVLARRVAVRVETRIAVTVVITRDCRGVTCPGDGSASATECLSGACVEPGCTPETPEACGPPTCTSDAECRPTRACVTATCAAGACLQLPEDTRCAADEMCSPADGCVPRTGGHDGGVDGGVDAGTRVPSEAVFQSVGGGEATSAGHRVRVMLGAPQPAGSAADGIRRVMLGPAAAGR